MKNGSVLATAVAVAAVPFERIQPLLTDEGARTLVDDGHGPRLTDSGSKRSRNYGKPRRSFVKDLATVGSSAGRIPADFVLHV
jgi:hypothetical protein